MPQRPTTHKDLHRAAIGSVFSLVYLLAVQSVSAQSAPNTASAGLSPKTKEARLVKSAPAKPTAAAPAPVSASSKAPAQAKIAAPAKSVAAPVKPLASPTTVIAVPEVKPAQAKAGKLREIPLSTLNGDKAVSIQAPAQVESKSQAKLPAKTDSASSTKTDGTAVKKTVRTKSKKTTASVPRLNNGLIPPPPPIIPIGMDALGMYAQPVDYLSMKDLEARKKELSVRFNELDSIVSDGQRQIKERKERADLFESLYQEGVVSRKELEIAKREAGDMDRDFKFKQDELESVKISMKAVNNRLAVLKKQDSKMNPGRHREKKNTAVIKNKSTQNN